VAKSRNIDGIVSKLKNTYPEIVRKNCRFVETGKKNSAEIISNLQQNFNSSIKEKCTNKPKKVYIPKTAIISSRESVSPKHSEKPTSSKISKTPEKEEVFAIKEVLLSPSNSRDNEGGKSEVEVFEDDDDDIDLENINI
jgi:hypothetical protein